MEIENPPTIQILVTFIVGTVGMSEEKKSTLGGKENNFLLEYGYSKRCPLGKKHDSPFLVTYYFPKQSNTAVLNLYKVHF